MPEQKHIIIICGEASGDLQAAGLIRAMRNNDPGLQFSGIGGPLMRSLGAQIYCDMKELSCIGLFDVLKKLPKFFALKKLVMQKIKTEKPDALILVDFSGFNLRLAKAVNKSVPVIYYISPQIWASRAGRMRAITKYIDKMLVVFKFEEELYKKSGMDVTFIGHPLLDIVRPAMAYNEFSRKTGLSQEKITIALLPGSRNQEIENILPIMLKTAEIISREMDNLQFIIAKPAHLAWDTYNRLTAGLKLDIKIAEGLAYDCLDKAALSIVASGTATLEAALIGKPFIIVYKMNILNYLLYRPQVKLPFIGMVNIVAQRKIIPEFIQFRARPEMISTESLRILKDQARSGQIKNELKKIKALLGEKGAAERGAKIILEFLDKAK